ncbi:hypothetical protein JCM10213v2_008266 [Rhodosporidiobolus nylandii]
MTSLQRSLSGSFDEKAGDDAGVEPVSSPAGKGFLRSTIFAATVTGLAAFLSPGIWNSMNSLGAGGGQDPWLVNAANSLVFGLMVVTCLFASSIVDRIGYRWALALGTAGYAPYAGGLVLNLKTGASWLVFLGSVTCGLSAGLFWGVEGAVILGYPEPHKRGRYLAYWLGFRNAGQILGGVISLALNANRSTAGSVGEATYFTFIALQCLGPLVAMLLPNPGQVWRKDGTPVQMESHIGFKAEMKQMRELLKRKEVLCLVPLAIAAQWPSSYAGTFLSLYFSVRARSLAALLIAILGVVVNAILGFFLDAGARFSKKTRARGAFFFVLSLFGVRYIKHKPKLDWTDGNDFAAAFTLYLFFQICYFLIQNVLYWLIAQLAREPSEMIRLSSFLRGLESAGSACGYGVSASKQLPYTVPLGINFGLWGVASFVGWFTVKEIGVTIDYST